MLDIFVFILLPAIALLVLSFAVAFFVNKRTGKVWAAAITGGCVIPLVWLIDGIIWLNDMAVDDPPPGMILAGYAVGTPLAVAIFSLICFVLLQAHKRSKTR